MEVSAQVGGLPDKGLGRTFTHDVIKHVIILLILRCVEQEHYIELLPKFSRQAKELCLDKTISLLRKPAGFLAGRGFVPHGPVLHQVDERPTSVNDHGLIVTFKALDIGQQLLIGLDYGTVLTMGRINAGHSLISIDQHDIGGR